MTATCRSPQGGVDSGHEGKLNHGMHGIEYGFEPQSGSAFLAPALLWGLGGVDFVPSTLFGILSHRRDRDAWLRRGKRHSTNRFVRV